MAEFYQFKKSGFKERQSTKLKTANKRKCILVDVDIANDGKIMLLHSQRDYTLGFTYMHILGKLDLETETWFVRKDEFINWFRKTFYVNNRFNIEQRLEWLSNIGLIEFKRVSNEVLTASEQLPNGILKGKVMPLEQVETQEYPEKDPLYISKQTKRSEASEEARAFAIRGLNFFTAVNQNNPNQTDPSWVIPSLEIAYPDLKLKRPDLPDETLFQCWCAVVRSYPNKRPNYLQTAFEGKVVEYDAKTQSKGTAPGNNIDHKRAGGVVQF